jgi:hypothetical protein
MYQGLLYRTYTRLVCLRIFLCPYAICDVSDFTFIGQAQNLCMWEYSCSCIEVCAVKEYPLSGQTQDLCLWEYSCSHVAVWDVKAFPFTRQTQGLSMWEDSCSHIALCDVSVFTFIGQTHDLILWEYSCVHIQDVIYQFLPSQDRRRTYVCENVLVPLFRIWCMGSASTGQTQDLVCENILVAVLQHVMYLCLPCQESHRIMYLRIFL